MKLWKAAALAMVAGSVPAHAAYIVYTVTGAGTLKSERLNPFGIPGIVAERKAFVEVTATFSIDLD